MRFCSRITLSSGWIHRFKGDPFPKLAVWFIVIIMHPVDVVFHKVQIDVIGEGRAAADDLTEEEGLGVLQDGHVHLMVQHPRQMQARFPLKQRK